MERHFPAAGHAALALMNDFKPLIIQGTAPVAAQGTAFAKAEKSWNTGYRHRVHRHRVHMIRNTLLTKNVTPVVRRGTHQDVDLIRKARLRRIRMMTSWSLVTSLPRQSSP